MTATLAPNQPPERRLSVAPMMDWTDRHCRVFHRLLAPRARLYTEMVPTGALLFGDRARFLAFDPKERPLALQLGGADPDALARAATLAEAHGFDEVNLNVGCPSERVQNARFGACLMREPDLVAACIAAMRAATRLPVTVKTRIGVDRDDGLAPLARFVATVAAAGCQTFIVHARKAWLAGLSPKQNREIPPLRPDLVHQLKALRPDLQIVLNGGLADPVAAAAHLAPATIRPALDGLMIGRSAYQDPWCLTAFHRVLFEDDAPVPSREAAIHRLLPYVERERSAGTPLKAITRHLLGLFNHQPGARRWRRYLAETAHRQGAGPEVLLQALAHVTHAPRRHAA